MQSKTTSSLLGALLLCTILLTACGGGSGGGSPPPPPPAKGTFRIANGSTGTSYDVRLGGAVVGTIAPAQALERQVDAGSYRIEFFLAGTPTLACVPEVYNIGPGQTTAVTCAAETCGVLGFADYTLRNTSTCASIAQDYFLNGRKVATLGGGQSTTLRFTPGTAVLRVNWADSVVRACTDTGFTVEACRDITFNCQGSNVSVFRFQNRSPSGRTYDFFLNGSRVVIGLAVNQTSGPVYVPPGSYTVRANLAGTSTRACTDGTFPMSHCQQRNIFCAGT